TAELGQSCDHAQLGEVEADAFLPTFLGQAAGIEGRDPRRELGLQRDRAGRVNLGSKQQIVVMPGLAAGFRLVEPVALYSLSGIRHLRFFDMVGFGLFAVAPPLMPKPVVGEDRAPRGYDSLPNLGKFGVLVRSGAQTRRGGQPQVMKNSRLIWRRLEAVFELLERGLMRVEQPEKQRRVLAQPFGDHLHV